MDIEATLKEIDYDWGYMQTVRGLMFWLVEPDESRDRKALVLLATFAKSWAEKKPPRLSKDSEFFIEFCQKIIDAGAKSDGPPMPPPWRIGIGFK